jgi:hypothetical protein
LEYPPVGSEPAIPPVLEDLTGTKWQFNNSLDFYGIVYWSYNIVGNIYNNEHSTEIEWIEEDDDGRLLLYNTYGGGEGNFHYDYDNKWKWYTLWPQMSITNAPIIEITGGADATNENFIRWLQGNATQIS